MKCLLIFSLLFGASLTAKAQLPALVDDTWLGAKDSRPYRLLTFGERLYYFATDSTHNDELWVYNDASKPELACDIYPGKLSSSAGTTDVDRMAVFGNKLYFQANTWDSSKGKPTGDEMFEYDGFSPAKVAFEIDTNPMGGNPSSLIVAGNKLFFLGDTYDSTGYFKLYGYDGANAPRKYPIKPWLGGANERKLGEYKGQLYFSADLGNGSGKELCVLNPATDTWKMVADINPGPGYGGPDGWLNAWNKLFFVAYTDSFGMELHSYDGKSVKRLTDLAPGTKSSVVGNRIRLAAYKGGVFFVGCPKGVGINEVYRWDSASGNTSLISPAGLQPLFQPVVFDNTLYFFGRTVSNGVELWKYDGTSCRMVTDLNPGAADGVLGVDFAIYNGRLYFTANNGKTGWELYRISPSSNSVSSVQWEGKAMVYPNPASAFATLSITLPAAQALRVSMTDINGREVFSSGLQLFNTGSNEMKLPITNLAAGQYFYHIDQGNGIALSQGGMIKL